MLSSIADTPGARSAALPAGASITSWAIAVYLGGISSPTTIASTVPIPVIVRISGLRRRSMAAT